MVCSSLSDIQKYKKLLKPFYGWSVEHELTSVKSSARWQHSEQAVTGVGVVFYRYD